MHDLLPYQDLTIVILAGGKSTRMGQDKGKLRNGKKTFSEGLISLALSLTENVIISVGAHNSTLYSKFKLPIIQDEFIGQGPLGGIVSVFPYIKTKWYVLLSIDTPLVSTDMITYLWKNKKGFEAIVFSANNHIHPLVGLYNYETLAKFKTSFNENVLGINAILTGFKTCELKASLNFSKRLLNINTPKEYQEFIEEI